MLNTGHTPEQPTRALLDTLVVSTWLDRTAFGPVAFLLIAPSTTDVEPQLRSLAAALALRPSSARIRESGERVSIRDGSEAVLLLDGMSHGLRLPPVGRQWLKSVLDRTPVCVALGLDLLPVEADRAAVGEYLAAATVAGRVHMGIATLAPRPVPRRAVVPGLNLVSWETPPEAGHRFPDRATPLRKG
jgi:hypothetical protein